VQSEGFEKGKVVKKNKQVKPKSHSKSILLGITVILVAGLAWYAIQPSEKAGVTSLAAAERPKTLSPALFAGDPKAQAAYQVAEDIPEVLEQLPCFCGCMAHYGHKNNLFCFSDSHGAGCNLCENIALDAKEMHNRGVPVDKIKQTIIDRYSHGEP
jgi:hypothetical protein